MSDYDVAARLGTAIGTTVRERNELLVEVQQLRKDRAFLLEFINRMAPHLTRHGAEAMLKELEVLKSYGVKL